MTTGSGTARRPRYAYAHTLRFLDRDLPRRGVDYPVAVPKGVAFDDGEPLRWVGCPRVTVSPEGALVATLTCIAEHLEIVPAGEAASGAPRVTLHDHDLLVPGTPDTSVEAPVLPAASAAVPLLVDRPAQHGLGAVRWYGLRGEPVASKDQAVTAEVDVFIAGLAVEQWPEKAPGRGHRS